MVCIKVVAMKLQQTFHIRRYWLSTATPQDVLNTLRYSWGQPKGKFGMPYVDINYYGEGDKTLTIMELRYSEWIADREEITYTLEGDDGLV